MSNIIETIRAEIERRIKEYDEQIVDIWDSRSALKIAELQSLLTFLDTLQERLIEGLEENIINS